VALEIPTPEITDGGRFYGTEHFAYSGPDGGLYRVTVQRIRSEAVGPPQASRVPQRAYWGGCGVQRQEQGGATGVGEKRFATERLEDGAHRVRFGERRIVLSVQDLRCASVSATGSLIAVADGAGFALFELPEADTEAALVPLVRVPDPTIQTVSFVGARQQALLTAHQHKVMIWRRSADGRYVAETVYRNTRPVLFAEGAPDASRMLVWLSMATAEATIEVVPIPFSGRPWLRDGPLWLVNQPDVFFGTDGGTYKLDDGKAYRLMPPVRRERLVEAAEDALSPTCRPTEPGAYPDSLCWPGNR
jgi:hypothetical protein